MPSGVRGRGHEAQLGGRGSGGLSPGEHGGDGLAAGGRSVSWYLRSLADADTHRGDYSIVTRSVHAVCGIEFVPRSCH
jgi:hypothetical protein